MSMMRRMRRQTAQPELDEERDREAAAIALASAQKPGAGVPAYLRWVNRPLGRRAAAAAYVPGLTPNAVTLLSGVCSLAGLR